MILKEHKSKGQRKACNYYSEIITTNFFTEVSMLKCCSNLLQLNYCNNLGHKRKSELLYHHFKRHKDKQHQFR